MHGNHIVDISSDDDSDDDAQKGLGVNVMTGADINPKDERNQDLEDDDVIVVGEVLPNAKRARKSSPVAKLVTQDDDDDCIVLDGDPDKPVSVEEDLNGESDDLVIIAERGQVACRDYPHSRHLCVRFPFDSTPHADHCNLCHCYACDSPAPCSNWGNGNLFFDHCHASEKEALWKAERQRAKLDNNASELSSTENSFWRGVLDQIPAPSPPLAQYPSSLVHVPRQAPPFVRPMNIRGLRPSGISIRHGYHSNLPSRPQIYPCNNNSERARVATSMHKRRRLLSRAVNYSLNNFRQAQENHLAGNYIVGHNQQNVRHSMEPHVVTTYSDSSAIQIPSGTTMPFQGQAYQICNPTVSASNNTYLDPNQNGNMAAQVSSTPSNSNTLQQNSQVSEGASYAQDRQQLPLIDDQPDRVTNPEFGNLEAEFKYIKRILFDLDVDGLGKD